MARRTVKFIQGGYYHIYNRGVNREPIFRTGENYRFLLERLAESATRLQMAVVAYCLMPNHYHFVLRQDGDDPIDACIQAVFNSYSKAFNQVYRRSGTLFEGPFKAIAVTRDDYLTHLCRYVHRNPLDARLVGQLEEWPYSNYLEWIEKRDEKLIDRAFARALFPSPGAYQDFVLNYTPQEHTERAVRALAFE